MFDFFKEVVINSVVLPAEEGTDAKGNLFKRFYGMPAGDTTVTSRPAKEGVFRVLRCADYVESGIVDKKIYKTVGTVGAVATVL